MTVTAPRDRATDADRHAPAGPGPTDSTALLVWALLALLLAVAVPLAPVTVNDPVVTWPRAGDLPTSTTLPLTPPRPASIDVTVPCAALAGTGPAEILRTMPADAPEAGLGLLATVAGDGAGRRLDVVTAGTTLLSVPVAVVGAAPCSLALRLDAAGAALTRDGVPLPLACGTCTGVEPPQVARLATTLPPAVAAGLAVTIHTDDRYASTPTVLKGILLVAELASLAVLAALLARRRAARRAGTSTGARMNALRRRVTAAVRRQASPADALVLLVSAGWVLVSPMNYDDSWYPLMARGAGVGGAMSNAVYMFNATEHPFVVSQYVIQAWGAVGGWSLPWMRALPLLFGLAVWVLLRVYLVRALHEAHVSRRRVPWALLVAHLVWWLPFGLTLRPEPLIVLLSVVVLLAADRARVHDSLPLTALAVGAATLAVGCSPTGLVAFAPLLVEAPHAWRALRTMSGRRRAVAVAVVAAAGSVVVPAAFGDATLGDVLEANAVHGWYYSTVPWYDELVHYQTLLNPGSTAWGRRGPILMTLAVLLLAAVSSGRRSPGDDGLRRILLHSAATTAIAFALLAVSPTKWVLHFPAVEASSTVLLAVALLRAALPAKDRSLATMAGVAVLVIAGSVSFAGQNTWPPFDRGMPFVDPLADSSSRVVQSLAAPHVGPVFLRNPLVWLAVAAVAVGWAAFVARRAVPGSFWARLDRPEPERAVLGAICVTLVVGMIAVFLYAPVRQYPGWSMAYGNVRDLVREPCGLQGVVTVLTPSVLAPGQVLGPPESPGEATGDFTTSDRVPPPRPVPGLGTVWHDAVPGGAGRGAAATPWYPLPPRAPGVGAATDVVVPVLDEGSGRTISVEFSDGAPGLRTTDQRVELDPRPTARTWAFVPVTLTGRERATAVRVVVADGAPSPSTLAVGAPQLMAPSPFGPMIAGRPARADQMSSAMWPCVDQTAVTDAIAPAAEYRLRATDRGERFNDLWTDRTLGGAWRTDDLNNTYVRLPATVTPGGPPTGPWGSAELVVPQLPVLRVEVAVGTAVRAGWERGPTLAREEYAGVSYQGTSG